LRVSEQAEKYREAEDIRRQRIREEEEAQKRTADYQMRLQEKLAERKMQERRRYGIWRHTHGRGLPALPCSSVCRDVLRRVA
jgi:hypothetical protein